MAFSYENDRIEQYQSLDRQARNNLRMFTVFIVAMFICSGLAMTKGSNEGWPWLIGAIYCLVGSMWSLIEARYFSLMVRLHLLPEDIRQWSAYVARRDMTNQ